MELVEPTIDRLKNLQADGRKVFLDVEGDLQLAGIIETGNPKRSPTAYVVLNMERPKDATEGTGPAVQNIEVDIVVVLAVKAVNETRLGGIEPLRRHVVGALFDWAPTTGASPYTRGPGKLLTFRNGWIYWAETFRTDYWEQ